MKTNHIKQRHSEIFRHLPKNSLVLAESQTSKTRNNDVKYPFRQHSNTIYLTNCYEANTFWAISSNSFDMACKPKDPITAAWIGEWTCPQQALDVYGVNCALPINEWPKHLVKLLKTTDIVWLSNAPQSETMLLKIKQQNQKMVFIPSTHLEHQLVH